MSALLKLIATAAIATAIASPSIAQDRTQDYRMWSADQMIKRIAEKMVRTRKACDQAEYLIGQRLSEKCIASVISTYPVLGQFVRLRAAATRCDGPSSSMRCIRLRPRSRRR